jgi:hypothetical protein
VHAFDILRDPVRRRILGLLGDGQQAQPDLLMRHILPDEIVAAACVVP